MTRTAPAWARALVWASAIIVIVLAGMSLAHSGDPAATAAATHAAASGTSAAATAVPAGNLVDKTVLSYYSASGGDPKQLLPAFRWQHTTLYGNFSSFSADDAFHAFFTQVATLLFLAATWIWFAIVQLLNLAMTTDMMARAAAPIDAVFARLAEAVVSSGLVAVIVLIALGSMAIAWLKGSKQSVMRRSVGLLLPVLVMTSLSHVAAAATNVETAAAYQAPKGSPTWLANRAGSIIDTVAGGMATSLAALAKDRAITTISDGAAASSAAGTCAQYEAQLESAYRDAVASQEANRNGLKSTGTDALIAVNGMWRSAFLSNWERAQFGQHSEESGRMACHWLEKSSSIDPHEQQYLAKFAYGGTPDMLPFVSRSNAKDEESNILAWAACEFGDAGVTAKARPGWDGLLPNPGDCKDAWYNAAADHATPDDLSPADPEALAEATVGSSKATASTAAYADYAAVQDTVNALWGRNMAERVTAGGLAALSSIAYGYALGGLALGAFVSQIGLVVLLMLMPGTLLLLAVDGGFSKAKSNSRSPGKRLLKLTGAFMASRAVFLLTLSLLLLLITVLQALVTASFGA